ncbi:MAG: hypothetical protein KGO81_14105 [Bacteroidota bacterium]|nr:hypothetical protein [Bacteroidota bacterium]
MKKLAFIFCFWLMACNSEKVYIKAENALDAGREFIDGCLKGDFNKAGFYLLHTTENTQLLNELKASYANQPGITKEQFKNASINILNIEDVSPAETIIHYQNSFSKRAHSLKVVNKDGSWQVDLKYSYDGNL